MTKREAIKKLTDYLNSHNIRYISAIDNGCIEITMVYNAITAPNKCIESCIWFYEDEMEARVYYSALGAEICRESEHINELLRVLNFINARVFLRCSDGTLYEPHILYTPRIYLTEDDCCDITITTIINYDFYEVAPVETVDYLTAYCPELLDKLTPAIYGVLLGKMTADMSIAYITEKVIEEKILERRR